MNDNILTYQPDLNNFKLHPKWAVQNTGKDK